MKNLLILTTIVFSLSASASPVIPADLVGKWVQVVASEKPESFEITPAGDIASDYYRQVGDSATSVPYPTVCYYRETGAINELRNPSINDVDGKTMEQIFGKIPNYFVEFKVNKVELLSTSQNDANCIEFAKQKNSLIQNGQYVFGSFYWFILSDSEIQNAAIGLLYKKI